MLTASTLVARQWIDNRRFWFSFIHSVLCRVPTADLRQHHDRQQCRKHKPGYVAFAISAIITAASKGPRELPKLPPT